MEETILIIEDDAEYVWLLQDLLEDKGFHVLAAGDGVEGIQKLEEYRVDLVFLDILMPRMDGWETCRCIRQMSDVPIIMLTSRTDEMEKVRGLELGADDYMTKPCGRKELVARVHAALRRGSQPIAKKPAAYIDDWLVFDQTRGQAQVGGRPVALSETEYKLLACFVDNANHTLTHQSLLTQVWGWEYVGETDCLKVYVHRLRKKIEPDPKQPRYILTERGLGYRFQALNEIGPHRPPATGFCPEALGHMNCNLVVTQA